MSQAGSEDRPKQRSTKCVCPHLGESAAACRQLIPKQLYRALYGVAPGESLQFPNLPSGQGDTM